MANLSRVAWDSWVIKKVQKTIEITGMTGTKGHLNFLGRSASCILSMIMEMARKMNAERVPMFTSSIMVFRGKKPAIKEAIIPTIKMEITGDLCSGCNLEKEDGNSPSRDMEKKIRV